MIRQTIQRIFSMTVFATYSLSLLAGLIYSKSLPPNLWVFEYGFINLNSLISLVTLSNQINLNLCLLCHCYSRTLLKRGEYKRTLQIMHKILHWLQIKLFSRSSGGEVRGGISNSTNKNQWKSHIEWWESWPAKHNRAQILERQYQFQLGQVTK